MGTEGQLALDLEGSGAILNAGTLERKQRLLKCELYNDSFQNFKKYAVPRAQLVIADVPYNVGGNMYGSNPMWYKGGDNSNGESKFAGKAAFYSDYNFNLYEYFHFCNRLLKKDPKGKSIRGRSSDAPCMIVFCSFEQIPTLKAAAASTDLYTAYRWYLSSTARRKHSKPTCGL